MKIDLDKRYLILLLAVVFTIQIVSSTEVAIITTDISYADYAVASVVAAKIGANVYFANGTEVTTDLINQLKASNVSTIYIIGGPAVVSENSENLLKQNFNSVQRIFGMTRYGTSMEAAKFFWAEGSDEIVVTYDESDHPIGKVNETSAKLVIKAAEFAANKKIPLILLPRDKTPLDFVELIDFLKVKKIYLLFGAELELNITKEEIKDENEIEERILLTKEGKPLVIAAVANWQDGLSTRAIPHGVSILVFSENEISNLINRVNSILQTRNVSKILVVGKPDLAQKIYNSLINSGIGNKTTVLLIPGKHYEIAKRVVKDLEDDLKEIRKIEIERSKSIEEKLAKKVSEFREECFEALVELNETASKLPLDNIVSKRVETINELINQCLNETSAKRLVVLVNMINSELKSLKWFYRNYYKEGFEEDVKEEFEEKEKVLEEIKSKVAKKNLEKLIDCKKELEEAVSEEDEEEREKEVQEVLEECMEILDPSLIKAITNPEAQSIITSIVSPIANKSKEESLLIAEVVITDSGFLPERLEVKKGTKVIFINKASRPVWPASDPHPAHNLYPGSGIEKCGTPEEKNIFDACRGINPGETWSFVFNEVGTWPYHDHLSPRFKGVIVVIG